MRLIKVTSTIPTFKTTVFNRDFNVIIGESSKTKDSRSHNLGKTTLVRIINFVLFSGSGSFLEKVKSKFSEAEFSVYYSSEGKQKLFSRGFKRRSKGEAKNVETSIDYEYFIRYQDEFDIENPFRKPKYFGSDINWKPRLLGLLGFDDEKLFRKLELNQEVKKIEDLIETIKNAKVEIESNKNELKELKSEKEEIKQSIKHLDFSSSSKPNIKRIINELDLRINDLQASLYFNQKEIEKISRSLTKTHKHHYDPSDVEKVFSEVQLYFGNQLKKNIDELNQFYENIFKNRRKVLKTLLSEKKELESKITKDLELVSKKRAIEMEKIFDKNIKSQYESNYNRLIEIEKSIALLERDIIKDNISELEKQKSRKQTESFQSTADLSLHIDSNQKTFEEISNIYSLIMRTVMNIEAKMTIEKRSTGNVDLILKSYREKIETEELKGDTAKRISSAAIDLAIRCIRNNDEGFLIHDGVIDDVDKNTAEHFIKISKTLSKQYNFQYIITALKDQIPNNVSKNDIILELNDYTIAGLLFGFRY